jgi:hypothetical protein
VISRSVIGISTASVLLFSLLGDAGAASYLFEFDGQVTSIYGSGPSLDATGMVPGAPVHYSVLVHRGDDGYYLSGDGSKWIVPDVWNSPEDNHDSFYAELVSAPYPSPGSYYGWNRELFWGVDDVSTSFPDCAVLGRLFVGVELFHIDGCGLPVAEWAPGMSVGSGHIWHDADTGEPITLYTRMTVTSAIVIPEPVPSLGLLGVSFLTSLLGIAGLHGLRGSLQA